ncbi:MAG: transient receptor potential cation channel subfamily er 1 [Rickettsiaceae bacterium]|jgi:hypothetical protein|nr:transient receptor potential cation channel subfamily er 1 [Rickettsiaceae bacterium]
MVDNILSRSISARACLTINQTFISRDLDQLRDLAVENKKLNFLRAVVSIDPEIFSHQAEYVKAYFSPRPYLPNELALSSPFHIAASKGDENVIKYLLAKNYNIEQTISCAIYGRKANEVTALHLACINGRKNIVDLLIAAGTNIDASCYIEVGIDYVTTESPSMIFAIGFTAMHLAATHNQLEIIEVLDFFNANFNYKIQLRNERQILHPLLPLQSICLLGQSEALNFMVSKYQKKNIGLV